MAATIEKVRVADDRFGSQWGVRVNDYKLDGTLLDLQDLLVGVSQQRAYAIESEVWPLEDIISRRNTKLVNYGKVLQVLTELQSLFTDDVEAGTTRKVYIGSVLSDDFSATDFWAIMAELGRSGGSGTELEATKSQTDGYVSRCKSNIDTMNNDAQKDMTRLQSVVDRRDESYSTATSLMSSVSDTRSSLIKNL